MFDYEGLRRVAYGLDQATFVPVCPNCGRFVEADKTILISENGVKPGPNATCKRCGRVEMPFEGFM
jgi:ribosomal protein L32